MSRAKKERSFTTWLQKQAERTDEVGKLAKLAASDKNWPSSAMRPKTFKHHLKSANGDPSYITAFDTAFTEWIENR